MNWVNVQYKSNLRKYEKKDGMKALVTYCLIMLVVSFKVGFIQQMQMFLF